MTLERVAASIKSKISTISGWETGERTLGMDDLSALAETYLVQPADLLSAPPSGSIDRRLAVASAILERLDPPAAEDWLRVGQRLAGLPTDGASSEPPAS